ncbi:MAG: hypothetical protein ONB45_02005, partial [candidate division KSB1 bacterium]|nr:hypothetical protein [candidate division KSB1 bacterium]
ILLMAWQTRPFLQSFRSALILPVFDVWHCGFFAVFDFFRHIPNGLGDMLFDIGPEVVACASLPTGQFL